MLYIKYQFNRLTHRCFCSIIQGMKTDTKKVLIVGNSAKEYALTKKLQSYGCEVFVAPGNSAIKEIAKCVDIREDNAKDLLEFALENDIYLTVATGEASIKSDISTLFQSNGQLIFAPTAKSANIALTRSAAKKFLYRLRIPTPRFGVFDKTQTAADYLKTAPMPQVIRCDETVEGKDRLVCTTFSTSKTFVDDLFNKGEKTVVLEDYVYGHEFTLYVVTDGYHALPLTSVANYKFMENDNGGILTSGVGAYAPDYKISKETETQLMKNVVLNVLEALNKKDTPYLGILGVDCVLKDDGKFTILDFKPFFSNHDSQAILNLVDENLLTLFEACAVGSFADDYETIKVSDYSSVSCVLSSRQKDKPITGLDLAESDITPFALKKNKYLEYETIEGKNLVVTRTAKTLSRARQELYEDIDVINFDGKKYRTDICKNVEKF